ncbi:hypothetical protein QBC47DRAFT_404637 [Echria macrotheca]|uniref:Uncharacterized protein n=1 Tax=Echria macrotheca TaxID=438768 RepID=A0AAJ0B8P7_9PEZI|nr:hypothetical protein QBC47DRAFT_404637 [Echria macrotheca]
MADQRAARTVTVAAFVPAFALCVAHAAVTNFELPAVGLVPLAFSSVLGIYLIRTGKTRPPSRARRSIGRHSDDEEAHISPEADEDNNGDAAGAHPFLLFVADVVLAASLMVVLVFTWIAYANTCLYGCWRPREPMLAAYATVPLMLNFTIHAWLALREFAVGVGLVDLIHYLMWHTVPPDCPHCGNQIRPETLKTPPWFRTMSLPAVSLPRPSLASVPRMMSGASGKHVFKAPAWMTGRSQDMAPLLAEGAGTTQQHPPFHDEYDEDAEAVRPSLEVAAQESQGSQSSQAAEVAEEIVVGKKNKGKGADESAF